MQVGMGAGGQQEGDGTASVAEVALPHNGPLPTRIRRPAFRPSYPRHCQQGAPAPAPSVTRRAPGCHENAQTLHTNTQHKLSRQSAAVTLHRI